jgi:hypothetical protein
MSKQVQIKQNNFSGGIADGIRQNTSVGFAMSKHFDIFTDPNRLIPYRSLKLDDTNATTSDMRQYRLQDFKYASNSNQLYGLGRTSLGLTKIVSKNNANTGNWSLPANSEGNGAVKNGCFVEFKDYMWGFQGTNQIFKWGLLSGTPSITDSVATVGATITSVADGVIASDANLYLAYNNVVVRIAPGLTVTDSAKTVPSNYKITSLANYGNYLAIAAAPIANFNGVSKVFLWDLSSDLFAETIDWGEGELRVIETIEGYLIGVTDRYLNQDTGAGRGSMIVQVYSGGKVAPVYKEVFTKKLTGLSIPTSKAVRNNRLFWGAKIMTSEGGEYVEGLWSFGRKNSGFPFTMTLDIVSDAITTGIQSFGIAGNFFFVSCNANGTILKTDESATYTETSVLETQIFDFGDSDTDKQLQAVKVSFAPLTTGQTVTVKYKVDSDTSWTTIGTFNTTGESSRTFRNIESSGDALAGGKEYQFRIESTGGAEITSLNLRALILNEI